MTNLNGKLSPHLVWLFALGALGLVMLATKLIPGPVTPKVMAGIYFAIIGSCATAATYLTRTSVLAAIAAFTLTGVGIGAWYYSMISSIAPGSGVASSMGLVFGIAFAVDGLGAGIAGTLFGLKLRKALKPAMAV